MRIAVLIAFFFMLAAPVHGQQVEDSAKAATDTSQAKLRQRKGLDKKEIGEPRVNNAPLYPEAKGFIEIPHTGGAEFRIGGSVRLDMMRDFEPAGEAALFVPSTIPVTGVTPGDENSFNMDIMPTRLTLEVRRPSDMGPMRAYFEFNMFGPDGTTGFNIWNAYVQAANILVGLAYSPFMDIDAFPVTVDFEGPNSAAFLIVPQIRYTLPLHRHWNLGLGLMQPQSEVQLPSVLAAPVNSAPDVSLRLRREEGWGHVQLRLRGPGPGLRGSRQHVSCLRLRTAGFRGHYGQQERGCDPAQCDLWTGDRPVRERPDRIRAGCVHQRRRIARSADGMGWLRRLPALLDRDALIAGGGGLPLDGQR